MRVGTATIFRLFKSQSRSTEYTSCSRVLSQYCTTEVVVLVYAQPVAPPPNVFTLNCYCIVRAVNHAECVMPFHSCPSRDRFCLSDSLTCRTSLLDAIVINDAVMERSAQNHVRPLSRYKSLNKSSDMGKCDSYVVTRGWGDLSVLFQHFASITFPQIYRFSHNVHTTTMKNHYRNNFRNIHLSYFLNSKFSLLVCSY